MFKQYIKSILSRICRYKMSQLPNIKISVSAKLDCRKIKLQHNCQLTIKEGSIIDGTLIFEQPEASILIGKNTFIGGSSLISSDLIEIGDDVLIAWGCTIIDHNSHALESKDRASDVKNHYMGYKNWDNVVKKPIHIGDKAWIGFNTIILKGVTIGEGSIIAAGSVVTKDVPPFTVFGGNPARMIRNTV